MSLLQCPIGDRIASIHGLPEPLLASKAHDMDLST